MDKIVDAVTAIENEIVALSNGIKKLRSGRLNDKAIIALIWDSSSVMRGYSSSKISRVEIREILRAVEDLPAYYLKKKTSTAPSDERKGG